MNLSIHRRRHLALLIFALLLSMLFSHALMAAHALPEFSAKYAVQKYGVKLAQAHYQLNHTESGYKFTHHTKLSGFANLFSNDTVSAESLIDEVGDNLLLTHHKYTQTGKKNHRDEEFSILWNTYKNTLKGKITGVVKNKKIQLETDAEVWEALSFQIPLMIEANEATKEYSYKTLIKGKIETYNFVLTSSKKISFAGKQYQSLQLIHRDPKKKRALHIWIIPKLHNIPVIIENYRKEKEHSRMQLESIQFNNQEILTDQLAEDVEDDY
ncbi:MAG: hypothetical protein COB77_00185 [Gammaproteobacteria bacterium]|nr:MAG: hypothetical protein COB77_00185 [Gammaproteobacteria bacterium]